MIVYYVAVCILLWICLHDCMVWPLVLLNENITTKTHNHLVQEFVTVLMAQQKTLKHMSETNNQTANVGDFRRFGSCFYDVEKHDVTYKVGGFAVKTPRAKKKTRKQATATSAQGTWTTS